MTLRELISEGANLDDEITVVDERNSNNYETYRYGYFIGGKAFVGIDTTPSE